MEEPILRLENIEALICRHNPSVKSVKEKIVSRLTAPGENYGSTMLKLDLEIVKTDGETQKLGLVAKMIPEVEFYQRLFNVQVSFKLEAAFYGVIVPTLQEFQRDRGVKNVLDVFPKFYGSRKNLDGSDVVDMNAVILLENLKIAGYHNIDRESGCDLDTTKHILRDLVQFHATPIAIKYLKPNIFEQNIKKYMACFYPDRPPIDRTTPSLTIFDLLKENDACLPLLPAVVKSQSLAGKFETTFREPFATISHQDMWINNFMVKMEAGKVAHNKFVDFQSCTYDSPARDILFFLFTSVNYDVLKHNIDYLLEYYYKNLVASLESLGCPTIQFSQPKFMEEIKHYGLGEIYHILFMLVFVVLGKKGGRDPSLGKDGRPGQPPFPTKDQILDDVKSRAWWIVQEFGKRKWI